MKRSSPLRRTPWKRQHGPRTLAAAMREDARNAALARDGHWPVCHQRGLVGDCWGGVEVHHILPRGRGGGDDLENLVTLCSGHHRWVHEHPAAAYELGLLRRSAA